MSKKKEKKRTNLKRELIEFGVIGVVIAIIYLGGWHTEVIGTLQRGLLATGIIRPDTSLNESEFISANYNFPLRTLEGAPTSLSDYKGKTIFLNFWATWCPPCIAEMPNIQKLYEHFESNNDIVFVMLSLDEEPEKARSFMARKGFTLPVYLPRGRTPGVYNSTVVPTTYIISPDGYIVSEKRGMANYNTDSFKQFLLDLSN
jgi:thiol-disulfide isomerase/thioredoxin